MAIRANVCGRVDFAIALIATFLRRCRPFVCRSQPHTGTIRRQRSLTSPRHTRSENSQDDILAQLLPRRLRHLNPCLTDRAKAGFACRRLVHLQRVPIRTHHLNRHRTSPKNAGEFGRCLDASSVPTPAPSRSRSHNPWLGQPNSVLAELVNSQSLRRGNDLVRQYQPPKHSSPIHGEPTYHSRYSLFATDICHIQAARKRTTPPAMGKTFSSTGGRLATKGNSKHTQRGWPVESNR